jgi:hypothetical protein
VTAGLHISEAKLVKIAINCPTGDKTDTKCEIQQKGKGDRAFPLKAKMMIRTWTVGPWKCSQRPQRDLN